MVTPMPVASIPMPPIDIVGILSLAVIGLLALFGLFNRAGKQKADETNKADDRLIGLLQGTVSQLEKKVGEQASLIKSMGDRMTALESDNKLMRDLLQGRDERTQMLIDKGLETLSALSELMTTVQDTNTKVNDLHKTIVDK